MKSTQDLQSQEESMSEIESKGSFISTDREAITANAQRPKATSFFVTTLLPNFVDGHVTVVRLELCFE